MRLKILAFLGGILFVGQNAFSSTNESVSLVRLLSSPESYHGKVVHVCGYLFMGEEGGGLYLNRDDSDYFITENAIAIADLPANIMLDGLNGKYVIVWGEFDQSYNGHMSAFSGSIKNITRLSILRSRLEYQVQTNK